MVELIHTPDPHGLLPPLLACLPTAFASSRPPPALLPLLSPILRQRLQLNSDPHDNWLRLLCWDRSKAESLKEQVENATFEPHPVSGEIEIGDIDSITYKRMDEETLRAQLQLTEWPFAPIFVWCLGEDSGWKLSELLPSAENDDSWSATIQRANESSTDRLMDEALQAADAANARPRFNMGTTQNKTDEDDYWAQYDQTPDGRTPARNPSVQPGAAGPSEDAYYARYGDVQPAMDNHDPDEQMQEGIESTVNGHALEQVHSVDTGRRSSPPPYQDNDVTEPGDDKDVEVRQPVPTSPSSRNGSDAIARLEDSAERFNASEVGIRQHISTSMKSMYRLAKSVGMDREEFDRIVNRELETLSIFDRDE
jgi:hypothetical protein